MIIHIEDLHFDEEERIESFTNQLKISALGSEDTYVSVELPDKA